MLLIGLGGVGTAVLELMPICGLLPAGFADALTIVEPKPVAHNPVLRRYRYRHVRTALKPGRVAAVLNPLLREGDAVLDCSVNVDALAVMAVCHERGCLYVNCSQEDWDTPDSGHIDPSRGALLRRALCSRIWAARAAFARGPTMLADIGMNPGIVSLFALQGLEDLARAAGDGAAVAAMEAGDYARAAQSLGVATVHITERDTQTLRRPRPRGEFWNTWSAVGLAAEALDPVQIGRGSHEPAAPDPRALDVKNMRIVPVRGMDVPAWSYSPGRRGPGGLYQGLLIPHGEANTLSERLAAPGYQPSVYFVYQPAPFARAALGETRRAGYAPPDGARAVVATLPQIRAGYDAVGALLWSARHPPWWSGTVLDRADMAPLGIKRSGPTTIQVAAAILAAVKWMLCNPRRGFVTPEDLPYRQVLRDCAPYLGRVLSGPAPVASPRDLSLATFLGAPPAARAARARGVGPAKGAAPGKNSHRSGAAQRQGRAP